MQAALHDAFIELSALQSLSKQPEEVLPVFPRLIKASFASPDQAIQAGLQNQGLLEDRSFSFEAMPWLVLELCQGKAVSPSSLTKAQAKLMGQAVAEVHRVCPGEALRS